jgi:hypothetical protein
MDMVPPEILSDLIAVGRSEVPQTPVTLRKPEVAHKTLLCGFRPWQRIGKMMGEVDLYYLIRGLVLFSQYSGWSGGSVSPVVNLYLEYQRRFPESEPDLAAWIVDNRRNSYEPFGCSMHSKARSYAEYLQCRANYELHKQSKARAREEDWRTRRSQDATRKLPDAVYRGDLSAVAALVKRGADLRLRTSTGQSMVEFALANDRAAVAAFLNDLGAGPAV